MWVGGWVYVCACVCFQCKHTHAACIVHTYTRTSARAHAHTHTNTQVLDTEKELSQQFSRENLSATDGDLAEDQETVEADESAAAPAEADGAAAPAPPRPPADADASFTLRLTLGVIEGLKDPNPPPPPPADDGGEAGEGGGGGEAGEDALPSRAQVLYDFYVANPPLYYVEVSGDCANDCVCFFDRAPLLAPSLPALGHTCARTHATTGGCAEAAGSDPVLGKNPMECHTPP